MDLHGNILLNPAMWVLGSCIKDLWSNFSLSHALTPSQWSIQCHSSIPYRLRKCRLWKSFPVSLLQERLSYIKQSCIKKSPLDKKKRIQNSRHHYRTRIRLGGICVICRHLQALSPMLLVQGSLWIAIHRHFNSLLGGKERWFHIQKVWSGHTSAGDLSPGYI